MRQEITFDKLKLTNHELNSKGHVSRGKQFQLAVR